MKTRAVVNPAVNELDLREYTVKEVGPDDVKVKVAFCAVGHNDNYMIDIGLTAVPRPWVLGYQASGVIVELGKKATMQGLKVGDRVTLNQLRPCGSCYDCLNGQQQFCSVGKEPVWGWLDGCMSEYVVFHQNQINKLPDEVSLEAGALTEIVATCIRGIDLTEIKVGNSVLISGGGNCGLVLVQLAKLSGGTKVTVIEPVESKRKLALKLGADYVIDPVKQNIAKECMKITQDKGFDRVIEASGNTDAINPLWDVLGLCSKVILFGCYPAGYHLDFDIDKIYMKEAGIQCVFGFCYTYPRAVAMLSRLELKSLVGPIYPLEKYREAFAEQKTAKHVSVFVKL